MNKETSLQLKGVAILMMLFLHLYNTRAAVSLSEIHLYFWDGRPLVSALYGVVGCCVPIYIFLSGYGLARTYERLAGGNMHNGRRVILLYANCWVVFALFIPLCCLLRPDRYPGSAGEVAANLLAYRCTYNHEWWFLFPYAVLALCSRPLLRLVYRLRGWHNALLAACACALYWAAVRLDHTQAEAIAAHQALRQLSWVVQLGFTFVCGAVCARHGLFERLARPLAARPAWRGNVLCLMALAGLCVARMVWWKNELAPFFALPMLACYACLRLPAGWCGAMAYFGRHSTNLWLTHTFFAYYLFRPFVYSFRYPPLVFAALLLLSLAASYAVDLVYKPLRNRLARLLPARL